MRVATYNQMFGMNGRSFWSTIVGHWAVHFQKDKNKVFPKTDINRTLKIIKEARADVIGVCEILEGQEKKFVSGLKSLGYRYIYFGDGHKTKSGLRLHVMIASKIKCEKKSILKEPVFNKIGGGGGIINCYLPSLRANVILVHLGTRKKLREREAKSLERSLRSKKKFILMGDFNSDYDWLEQKLKNFKLVSERIKTCSLTPIFNWFVWSDMDHIFLDGFKKKRVGSISGDSDHKLLYLDLE